MRFIVKYRPVVVLMINILRECCSQRNAERLERIYRYVFVQNIGSDQDFFEAVNWFARVCIIKCTVHSLRCSRKFDFDGIRFWNSCIIAITPLLGDRPWYDVDQLTEMTRSYVSK